MFSRSLLLALICCAVATNLYSEDAKKKHFNTFTQALLNGKIDSNIERVVIKETDEYGNQIETEARIDTTETAEYSIARFLPLAGIPLLTLPLMMQACIQRHIDGCILSTALGTALTIAYTLLEKRNTIKSLSVTRKQGNKLIDGTNEMSLYSPAKSINWKTLPRNVTLALVVHAAAFVGGAIQLA